MVGFMGMGSSRGKIKKRKEAEDLDQVSHDFSDFSLSSPARKIRRLDAELPPIMEEEEPEIGPPASVVVGGGGPVIEELESDDNKAIVLFKPIINSPFSNASPSNISVSVDSHLISGFKDELIRSRQQRRSIEDDIAIEKKRGGSGNECLAVVPWAPPSQLLLPAELTKSMQAEEEDTMEMEIEDANESSAMQFGQGSDGYGIPHWQQQHCMLPQPPHNTSTPITWFQ